jgi:Glycosyl hydrolases family 38 N-terminal domain
MSWSVSFRSRFCCLVIHSPFAVFSPIGHQLHRNVTLLYDVARTQTTTSVLLAIHCFFLGGVDWHAPTQFLCSPFGKRCLYIANQVINTFRRNDTATWLDCVHLTDSVLGCVGAASCSIRGQLFAVGNCHIDTAWLWPFDETRRKVARSFATAIEYASDGGLPSHVFTASQAQQFQWLKDDHPDLFGRMQTACSKGRFIPVGGCWVEMDANIPTGESFVRQLLLGQTFFKVVFVHGVVVKSLLTVVDCLDHSESLV